MSQRERRQGIRDKERRRQGQRKGEKNKGKVGKRWGKDTTIAALERRQVVQKQMPVYKDQRENLY